MRRLATPALKCAGTDADASFDHRVGAGEQRRGNVEAERLDAFSCTKVHRSSFIKGLKCRANPLLV